MSTIEEMTRRRLAQSIHLVEAHKDQLLEAVEAPLRSQEQQDEDIGQAEMTARILTDLLVAQARMVVDAGALDIPPMTAAEHHLLGISGRHYSRYGDALVPVLRDVLGPNLPADVAASWGDAFWAIITETRLSRTPSRIASAVGGGKFNASALSSQRQPDRSQRRGPAERLSRPRFG